MTDFDLQQQLLAQRRDRFAGQREFRSPQGQMVGRHFVAPNALQFLAEGLRSYGGIRGQEMAEKELTELSGQRKQATADALRRFGEQAQGRPADMLPPDQAGPVRPAQAPDMQGAFAALMEAPDAGLRQAGMQGVITGAQQTAERQRAMAEQQRQLQLISSMSPQEAIAAGANPELVKTFSESKNFGRPKVDFKDSGGQFIPVTEYGDRPEGVAAIDKTGNPFSDLLVRGPDGQMMQNAPLVGAKTMLAQAGRSVNNTQVINAGPRAFDVELAKLDAKQMDQWRDKAEQARSSLGVVQRLRMAEDQGAFSGGLANQKLAAANLINGITGVTPKGLVGSQIYNAEASKLVLDFVKTLGANPSNADREFILQTVPNLTTSKEARQKLTQFIENSANRTLGTFEQMDEYARKNQGLGGFQFDAQPQTAQPAMPSGFKVVR